MVDTLLVLAAFLLGAVLGWVISGRFHFRPATYFGRIVASGRVQDRIPSLDGGHANMTAYTVSMTNPSSGDLSWRIYKRDNPLWFAFEQSGPSDVWEVSIRRVKRVHRRVASVNQMKEGLFHDNREPEGAFTNPWK